MGKLWVQIKKHKLLYAMIVPSVAFFFTFHYFPLFGWSIAFQDYVPGNGFFDGPWVGFDNFVKYFSSYYFWRLITNTLALSFYSLFWGFPMPIILALLLNEVRHEWYKRGIQTLSYIPNFVPAVVLCGVIVDLLGSDGLFNTIFEWLHLQPVIFLQEPGWFRSIYVLSGIWSGIGFGAIIYLATLASIDPTLYEAAEVDGAGRVAKMIHITLPSLMPTVILMLILAMGGIMGSDFEKIILLYKPLTYDTSDVISSFIFRRALQEGDYSFGQAVGIFNSLINLLLVVLANYVARKATKGESGLW